MNSHAIGSGQFGSESKSWQRHAVVTWEGVFQFVRIFSAETATVRLGGLCGTGHHQEISAIGRTGAHESSVAESQNMLVGVEVSR